MKTILLSFTILILQNVSAQQGLVTNSQSITNLYIKASPSMLSIKDGDVRPAAFAAIGARLSRYAGIGLNVGYFKFKGANRPVVPIGVDLTVTDLKTNKIAPIFVLQCNYPIYDDNTNFRSPLSLETVTSSTTGRFMYSVGGGLALPLTQTKKVIATASFSQLFIKSKIVTKSFFGEVLNESSQNEMQMVITSLTFLF
jgi:hypothetical protein